MPCTIDRTTICSQPIGEYSLANESISDRGRPPRCVDARALPLAGASVIAAGRENLRSAHAGRMACSLQIGRRLIGQGALENTEKREGASEGRSRQDPLQRMPA